MAGEEATVTMDPVDEQHNFEETHVASDQPDDGELQTETEVDADVVSEENGSKDEAEPLVGPGIENGSEEPQDDSEEPASPAREDKERETSRPSERLTVFPLSRIKHIIKADPDVSLASLEAVVLLSKAAELFVVMMSREAAAKTLQTKRKTMQRRDIDILMDTKDCYFFLADTLDP